MNEIVLVDFQNLLYQLKEVVIGFPKDFGGQRKATANLLSQYGIERRREVMAFLDGSPGAEGPSAITRPNLHARFSPGKGSNRADYEIMDYLVGNSQRAKFWVVSSDKQIIDFAHSHGANTISSQSFAQTLATLSGQARPKSSPPSKSQHKAPKDDKARINRRGMKAIEDEMLDGLDFDQIARDALKDL